MKNLKNYHDQELIRFIFQNLDKLSHIKWYTGMILQVIKLVDFHHFGKNINVKVTLRTESASEFFSCSLVSAIYILT